MLQYLVAREQEAEAGAANLGALETDASRAQGRGLNNISAWDEDPDDFYDYSYTLSAPGIPSASPIVVRTAPQAPSEPTLPAMNLIMETSSPEAQESRRRFLVDAEHDTYLKLLAPTVKDLGKIDLVKFWNVSILTRNLNMSTYAQRTY